MRGEIKFDWKYETTKIKKASWTWVGLCVMGLTILSLVMACNQGEERSYHEALDMMGAKDWSHGTISSDVSADVISGYSRHFFIHDENGDGLVSLQEYLDNSPYKGGDLTQIFKATDRDGDGMMTEQEYINNRIITDEGKRIFVRMDADGNGKLTEAEFLENSNIEDKEWAKELFLELDSDGSGDTIIPEYLKTYGNWAR